MGTVHLIQGGLLFWLGTVVNSDFVVPITLTQLVGVGSPEDPSSFALIPELEIWTEVTNFGPAVATFLLAYTKITPKSHRFYIFINTYY